MSKNQKIFMVILSVIALIGFANLLVTKPIQVLLMFLLTGAILFVIKKFAIDPMQGKHKNLKAVIRKKTQEKNAKRPVKNYPFKVIEGNKGKKQKF